MKLSVGRPGDALQPQQDPRCRLCGGACCKVVMLDDPGSDDALRWLGLRGGVMRRIPWLKAKCSKLAFGRCSCYAERPDVCRALEVGSAMCLAAIQAVCPERLAAIVDMSKKMKEETDGR